MKPIVIATDFSEVALNAVHFGCCMAKEMNTSVAIIHCYMIPITFNDDPLLIMPMEDAHVATQERLQQYRDKLSKQYPEIKIDCEMMIGDIADCINDYSAEHEVGLIIMGNSAEGSAALWLGSNVKSVVKHSKAPVLAVPENSSFQKPQNIAFACDFQAENGHEHLKELASFIQTLGAKMHIINVDNDNQHFQSSSVYEDSLIHQLFSHLQPEYHFLEGKNTDEIIQDFVEKQGMDWLVLVPHHHPFIENLFHKSHTSNMIKKSHVPLLAIHEK